MDPSLVPLANPIAQNVYAQFGAFMLLAAAGWIMWWFQRGETKSARSELAAARIAFEATMKAARDEIVTMHATALATVDKNSTAMTLLAERLRGGVAA